MSKTQRSEPPPGSLGPVRRVVSGRSRGKPAVPHAGREQAISRMLAHARGVAARVYGDGARVRDPEIRREVLGDGTYVFVAVEIPSMGDGEFIRKYDAFMDDVWAKSEVDPSAITFSVQTRADA